MGKQVHERSRAAGDDTRCENHPGLVTLEGADVIMYVCVIDLLTSFCTARKFLEYVVTSVLCGGRDVSCQPPRKYARRFVAFVACMCDVLDPTAMPGANALPPEGPPHLQPRDSRRGSSSSNVSARA